MTDFEEILCCVLIPIAYVISYIAGKYDILTLVCKMLEEKAKEYLDKTEEENKWQK